MADKDDQLVEDLLQAILNLAKHENQKVQTERKNLAENPALIPLLINCLGIETSPGIIIRAANSLEILANSFPSNGIEIVKTGGLKALIKLLRHWNSAILYAVAPVVRYLCERKEHAIQAVNYGLVTSLVNKIRDHGVMDGFTTLLLGNIYRFTNDPQLIDIAAELSHLGTVPLLLRIIKVSREEDDRAKAVGILNYLCEKIDWHLGEVVREERRDKVISNYARSGSGSERGNVLAGQMLQKMKELDASFK